MELGLLIIKTKANLWAIKERIKIARNEIEAKRPEAKAYITGALQSEKELTEAYQMFTDLYEHALSISLENNVLARRNIELMRRVQELEMEIKTSNF